LRAGGEVDLFDEKDLFLIIVAEDVQTSKTPYDDSTNQRKLV